MVNNIKIVTSSGRNIDYNTPESLNIKLNRIGDDLQDASSRFGEYSYTFSLPKTANNAQIFGFAGTAGIRNAFNVSPIDIRLFNNDILLLTGQLELRQVKVSSYECVFYSKFTQIVDALKDKKMSDITCPIIPWNYETTIETHINADYKNSDEAQWQFPLIYYNTWFCPESVYKDKEDTIVDYDGVTNHTFAAKRSWQNWYYLINKTTQGTAEFYYHQQPLAFYLKSAMELMFEDIGYTMSGSFWEDENIKSIIIPYVGDSDVYEKALFCDGINPSAKSGLNWISGHTCYSGDSKYPAPEDIPSPCGNLMCDTKLFMPNVSCDKFLSDIINIFNLYFTIDIQNQTIVFETYDVMFGSKIAPYDISNKLIPDTINIMKMENNNPSITWEKQENERILGDNQYMITTGTSAYNTWYNNTKDDTLFNQVFNHVGTTDGDISIGFQAPSIKRMRIRNEYDINDVYRVTGEFIGDVVAFMPAISKQLPDKNDSKPFNGGTGETIAYNSPENMQFAGKPTLYYYYGMSTSDFVQQNNLAGIQSNFFWYDFGDNKQKIPVCSPFALTAQQSNIDVAIKNAGQDMTLASDASTMLASYMKSIWLMLATTTGVTRTKDFSLIFCNNVDYGDTLYSKFYATRFQRYQQSEIVECDILMNDYDWQNMTINTPILYNHQIYSIVSILNYDIVKHQAQITLIKQL
jgi:hypothetical protein